jgi:hypothetical protein
MLYLSHDPPSGERRLISLERRGRRGGSAEEREKELYV